MEAASREGGAIIGVPLGSTDCTGATDVVCSQALLAMSLSIAGEKGMDAEMRTF